MLEFRFICSECTGFIKSGPVPEDFDEQETFYIGWKKKCHQFKEMPCPHFGDGELDPERFKMYVIATESISLEELNKP